VGIDFTASNLDPSKTNSLHYFTNNKMNDYQKAILSVGQILDFYDSDHKYPVYGFGAKLPPKGEVSHCFPLNGNFQSPEVYGVNGILQAYNYSIKNVRLHGPTIFSKLISTAALEAQEDEENNYVILLILTDGEISDMQGNKIT
jgi:copine 5/8/9